jgi:hypothetical protein
MTQKSTTKIVIRCTAVAACLEDEITPNKNLKHRIPKAIRKASAKEIEHLFKRKENKMFSFNDDSDLASIANSIASYKLPEETTRMNAPRISDLQTLLQTHHLHEDKDDVISALSDSSILSFDSKASKNRYEIERRADQMASKKADLSIHQLKVKQGLTLMQSGALTKELAHALELPYEEIVSIHSSQGQQDQILSEVGVDDPDPANALEQMMDTTIENLVDLPDSDPLAIHLPHSDDSSTDTPLRGSPNKNVAPGSQNAGLQP